MEEAEAELSQQTGTALEVMSLKLTVHGKEAIVAHAVVKLGTATAALWSSPPQLAVTVKVL